MKKESEIKNEVIGLEEINQTEKEELNGGRMISDFKDFFIVCCWNIPPMESTMNF